MGHYSSMFFTDFPPAFAGSRLLYWIATSGQLIVSVLAMMWFWDSWRRLREDAHGKNHPVTVHRIIQCLLMIGTFMRIFPMAVQNLTRPEITEIWRLRISLITNMASSASAIPFVVSILLYMSTRWVFEQQLKKEPFAIDRMPRLKRVKRVIWIAGLCLVISTLAALR